MVKKLLVQMLFVAVTTSSLVANQALIHADEYVMVEQYVKARLENEALHNRNIAKAMQTEAAKKKLIALGVVSLVVGSAVVAYVCEVWPFNGKKETSSADKQQQGSGGKGVSTPFAGGKEGSKQSQTASTAPNASNNVTPNESGSPAEATEDVGVRLLTGMPIVENAQEASTPSGRATRPSRKGATKRIPKGATSTAGKDARAVPQPTRVQPRRWVRK